MFTTTVDSKPIRDGETPAISYTIERFRDGIWTVEKVSDVTAGEKDSQRRILLEDDQRLVIQAVRTDKKVYDPIQMAVVEEGSEDKSPTTAEGRYALMQEEDLAKERERKEREEKTARQVGDLASQGNERQVLRDQQQPAQHKTTQVAAPPAPTKSESTKPNPASPQPAQTTPGQSTQSSGMRSSKDMR